MYFRIVRNVFNTSTKFSKEINKSAKLIFPTSLTVPKFLAYTNHYSAQNYSSNRESLDKRLTSEDLSNEQSDASDECQANEQEENANHKLDLRNAKSYFNQIDQGKLNKILEDNPEMQKLKKIIELEIIVLQQDNECVPSNVQPSQWIELLALKSKSQRRKYYKYLFVNEKVSEKLKKQRNERQLELVKIREERKKNQEQNPRTNEIIYGFADNFMLRRISNLHINNQYHWNSLRAIMYGNKLVFDCSYDKYMSWQEIKSCAKQLNEAYALNRSHDYPFEIFLTNISPNSRTIEALHRFIPILYEKDFPFTVTEKSYLELFDRSKLCYLSYNAPSELEEYDHESVYIIGAYVDKGSKQPISFAKAKREGLRMAKLPLDKYLDFGFSGDKNLTLNQVCAIMLDSQCKSWPEALKHVPTRKLQESRIKALESKIRSNNMRNQDTCKYNRNLFNSESQHEKPSSMEVDNFSHSARAKLRERWTR